MSLLERIKATIFGVAPPAPPRPVDEDEDEIWAGIRQADENSLRQNVSTPADDPVMDDIAAAGVQPLSKPFEIEEAQNPKRQPATRLN